MFGGGCPSNEQNRSTASTALSVLYRLLSSIVNVWRNEAFRLNRGRYDMWPDCSVIQKKAVSFFLEKIDHFAVLVCVLCYYSVLMRFWSIFFPVRISNLKAFLNDQKPTGQQTNSQTSFSVVEILKCLCVSSLVTHRLAWYGPNWTNRHYRRWVGVGRGTWTDVVHPMDVQRRPTNRQ